MEKSGELTIMICIFCQKEKPSSTEHIVPESMGNTDYIFASEDGCVCPDCNNKFSKFEDKVLSQTFIGAERTRLAAKTKKGNASKANIGGLKMTGSESFEKNLITFGNLNNKDLYDYDPLTNTYKFTLTNAYTNNENSLAKFLLKIGFESIFNDKHELYKLYDFSDLRDFLLNKNNMDWPILLPKPKGEIYPMNYIITDKKVRTKLDKYFNCKLLYHSNEDKNLLLFKFQYGVFKGIINLIDRNTEWMSRYKVIGFEVLPKYFEKRIS